MSDPGSLKEAQGLFIAARAVCPPADLPTEVEGEPPAGAPQPATKANFADKAGHRHRLRQRLLEGGAAAFHDYELLEYLLALAIPRQDVKPLAKKLLVEFGDLPGVFAASAKELQQVKGVGETVAAAIKFIEALSVRQLQRQALDKPLLANFQAVQDYLHARLAFMRIEEFWVLFLDQKNRLIRDEKFAEGTVNQTAAYPREIIKRALELQASGLILVHNHPSGDPTPSREDMQLTRAVMDAAKPLGIQLIDHLVIARSGFVSFRSEGLLL